MRLALVPALLVAAGCAARVAPPDPIVTDRPDFTESVPTVPYGWMQVEAGFTAGRDDGVRSRTSGEVLVRVGMHPRVEARVGVPSYTVAGAGASRTGGFEDASVGAKIGLGDGGGWRPATSVIVATSLPTGHRAFRSPALVPEAKLGLGWDIGSRASFTSNLNAALPEGAQGRFAELAASGSVGYALAERAGTYAEWFAFFPRERGAEASSFVNGGITWLATPHSQLDARAGRGLARNAGDWFVGLGVARRW